MKHILSIILLSLVTGVFAQESMVNDYLALKDALVQSDVVASQKAATELKMSLEANEMDRALIDASGAIAATNDLAAQRSAFKTITDGMIKSVRSDGTDQVLYVQYCPMAFSNTGASWLSMSAEIRNPYFGDKMLKCGSVKEKIESN